MNNINLKNKNILIGVTGSIAIYKTLELIRLFIKSNANVKVIMTQSSQRFVTALTFEVISQNSILDENSESWSKQDNNNHIDIGKWADIFVIAPASVNSINKLANGIADNLLTQTAIAYTKEILIAPAANTNMVENIITKNSLKTLQEYGYTIVEPTQKLLACGDNGNGAMADVEEIFYITTRKLLKDDYWSNREVLISGGGTVEKIDDIRYISNFSSGKMASNLATALYLKGADVTLVSTRGFEAIPKQIKLFKVQSSNEMYEELNFSIKKQKLSKKPYLFMVAAVSDYLPKAKKGKQKKDTIGEKWDLELFKNIDILSKLDKKKMICVGFKAETDENSAKKSAKNMLENKNLDAVCLNILNEENSFGSLSNKIELLLKGGSSKIFSAEKLKLSFELADKLKEVFSDKKC